MKEYKEAQKERRAAKKGNKLFHDEYLPMEGESKPCFLADSNGKYTTFEIKFPKYREKYLRDTWGEIKRVLGEHSLKCDLDIIAGIATVSATSKTADPYIPVKGQQFMALVCRSVPIFQAKRILEDNVYCDFIKIGRLYTRNKEKFIKRRERLVGHNGAILKAMEILTNCYILPQGGTVSAIGSIKDLKKVRQIVIDCMQNKHPIYALKRLMIQRELEKNPEMANVSWDHLLPSFKSKNQKSKSSKSTTVGKSEYSPFPPEQTPRKEDLAMERGEYFIEEARKKGILKRDYKKLAEERKLAKNKEALRELDKKERRKMEKKTKARTELLTKKKSDKELAHKLKEEKSAEFKKVRKQRIKSIADSIKGEADFI